MATVFIDSKTKKPIIATLLELAGIPYTFTSASPFILIYGKDAHFCEKKLTLWIREGQRLDRMESFQGIPYFFKAPNSLEEIKEVFWGKHDKPVFYKIIDRDIYVFDIDIVNSTYYFLSLNHEKTINEDKHGRKLRNPNYNYKKPLINYYAGLLKKIVEFIAKNHKIHFELAPMWPKQYEFAVALTHDIDYINAWRFFGLYRTFEEFKALKYLNAMELFLRTLNPKASNPLKSFEKFVNIENGFDVKSTFLFLDAPGNFMTALTSATSTYSIDSEFARDTLKFLKENGSEIALHGSYNSYLSVDKLVAEKEHLEKVLGSEVIGVRQHYLRFKYPTTWEIQAKAGFKYDTTLNYPDTVGFRSLIAAPYFPPTPDGENHISLIELPLVIMDRTFTKYIRKDMQKEVFSILEETKKVHGLSVILWHNSSVDELGFSGYWDFYKKLLKFLKDSHAWVTSASGVYKWWMERRRKLQR